MGKRKSEGNLNPSVNKINSQFKSIKKMKILLSIGLYLSVYSMFFVFPQYYNELPILKVFEVVKWFALVFSIIDLLVMIPKKKQIQ